MWVSSRCTRRTSVTQPSAGALPRSSRIAFPISSSPSVRSCLRRLSWALRHSAGRVCPESNVSRKLATVLATSVFMGVLLDSLGQPECPRGRRRHRGLDGWDRIDLLVG